MDNLVSLCAATKNSNELMAHACSKLYNIQSKSLLLIGLIVIWMLKKESIFKRYFLA